jgi:hypothetical protein
MGILYYENLIIGEGHTTCFPGCSYVYACLRDIMEMGQLGNSSDFFKFIVLQYACTVYD